MKIGGTIRFLFPARSDVILLVSLFMAAWKIHGAGDHAVTRTKTIFYFAAWPDLSMRPLWKEADGGPLLDEWPLSIELQCRTRWQELLQHELRVLREGPR